MCVHACGLNFFCHYTSLLMDFFSPKTKDMKILVVDDYPLSVRTIAEQLKVMNLRYFSQLYMYTHHTHIHTPHYTPHTTYHTTPRHFISLTSFLFVSLVHLYLSISHSRLLLSLSCDSVESACTGEKALELLLAAKKRGDPFQIALIDRYIAVVRTYVYMLCICTCRVCR